MSFKRILIAVDGSETAIAALRQGLELAVATGATVHSLFVFEPPVSYATEIGLSPEELIEVATAENKTIWEAMAVVPAFPMGNEHLLRIGHPATIIDKEATVWPADLIVIGSHGRSGISRVLLGSVAEHVVRHAPCPVLVVPRRRVPSDGAHGTG